MRAAVRERYGPAEVVHLAEVPAPVPGPGEVLVRVHVSAVNRTDCGYRSGTPRFIRLFSGIRPRARVLGTELAGVVEEVGPEVGGFAVGDRVFAYVEGRFGAHAELVAVRADRMLATVPDDVDLERAAVATEGAHYALTMIRRTGVLPGQHVLVHGPSGAIGSAAVQLLVAMGVRVTAVCLPEHRELARALGAEEVVAVGEELPAGGAPFAAVLDAVGKSTFGHYRRHLEPRGTYTSSELGPAGQNVALAVLSRLSRGRRVVFPLPMEGREVIDFLRDRLADGSFRPVVDRTYALEEIVEAYRYVETGTKVGNVLLRVVDRP